MARLTSEQKAINAALRSVAAAERERLRKIARNEETQNRRIAREQDKLNRSIAARDRAVRELYERRAAYARVKYEESLARANAKQAERLTRNYRLIEESIQIEQRKELRAIERAYRAGLRDAEARFERLRRDADRRAAKAEKERILEREKKIRQRFHVPLKKIQRAVKEAEEEAKHPKPISSVSPADDQTDDLRPLPPPSSTRQFMPDEEEEHFTIPDRPDYGYDFLPHDGVLDGGYVPTEGDDIPDDDTEELGHPVDIEVEYTINAGSDSKTGKVRIKQHLNRRDIAHTIISKNPGIPSGKIRSLDIKWTSLRDWSEGKFRWRRSDYERIQDEAQDRYDTEVA